MIDTRDPCVESALAADQATARSVLTALEEGSRDGHPACDHLRFILRDDHCAADLARIVAVAFEAGVRVYYGRITGPSLMHGRIPEELDDLLERRFATSLDSSDDVPYTEISWRRAISHCRTLFAKGKFRVPEAVPGALLLNVLRNVDGGHERLLGEPPQDDVLDPIAATGNFLAEAIPGYMDIDLALRQLRQAKLETDI